MSIIDDLMQEMILKASVECVVKIAVEDAAKELQTFLNEVGIEVDIKSTFTVKKIDMAKLGAGKADFENFQKGGTTVNVWEGNENESD